MRTELVKKEWNLKWKKEEIKYNNIIKQYKNV